MRHEIIPPHLAIRSMRDSGYRDTAYALAELIDNSIEAGIAINDVTKVEVLCIERMEFVQKKQRKRIDRIAVYDNASGMDREVLRLALQFGNGTHLEEKSQTGIGKFGMGLPNSSISQCRRVDVWSWQNDQCLHTYLDIDNILKGEMREVPEPTPSEIPKEWRKLIRDEIGSRGTLVVWTKLDRLKWKSSKALLDNIEFLVGRIYRYFINEEKVSIRCAAFEENGGDPSVTEDRNVRPNDPLFLMRNTSAPAPYDREPAFDFVHEEPLDIKYNGVNHTVKLRFSMTKPGPRHEGGSSPIGRYAAKNQGVSVVRARREIDMNRTFESSYDPKDRWWGVEVLFDSGLDEVFGVTNNKQSATAFHQMDLDRDAKLEGMTPGDYKEYLEEIGDTRIIIYELSQRINKVLNDPIRPQINRMREGTRRHDDELAPPGSAEDIAARVTKRRREQIGDKGKSDQEEKLPEAKRIEALTEEFESEGLPNAREKALSITRAGIKYLFQETEVPGAVIFDVKSKAGTIIININSRHPASQHLFELLENSADKKDSPALKALKLLLSAWARLEDEAGDQTRQELEDIRSDWGKLARDFLQAAED